MGAMQQRDPMRLLQERFASIPRTPPFWIMVAVIAALAILPATGSLNGYWLNLLTYTFMYAALASGVNIISGYAGYADFGNVVFVGVGAYTGALLLERGVALALAIIAGGAVSALYAFVLGLALLRLRGHYFAIATIGVLGFTRQVVDNVGFTGGAAGISVPLFHGSEQHFATVNYELMGALMVVAILVSALVRSSRLGFAVRAIKSDETAAAMVGVAPTASKSAAWVISAAIAGMVGALYMEWVTYLTPDAVFSIVFSTTYFIMMLLGGAGSVLGPVVGAVVMELLTDVAFQQSGNFSLGLLGLLVIVVVVLIPGGLFSWMRGGFRLATVREALRRGRL